MAKTMTQFRCTDCGNVLSAKPRGACPKCGEFLSYEKESAPVAASPESSIGAGLKTAAASAPITGARKLHEIQASPAARTSSGIGELDRVLGGGFVDAEVVLLSGAPGAGKSTLSMMIAANFASESTPVLYSSGEESEEQIALRAARMQVDNEHIHVINETSLEALLGYIDDAKPAMVIVDSLQTVASAGVSGSIGSVGQSKEAAHVLTHIAKQRGITMVLISQVVKSGDFSGSEAVQHIVDATLMFEADRDSPLKFLRARKNRFGDTSEVGVFHHTETGLAEVSDPSGILISEDDGDHAGAVVGLMSEGVRQISVEVQSLVSISDLPHPRKQFNGISFQRGQIVCAILDKFCGTKLYNNDTFINTVSGIRVDDPVFDLAIAAAVLSSSENIVLPRGAVFLGELSLTGQVRGSFMFAQKLKEAARLGFTHAVVPSSALRGVSAPSGLQVVGISSASELTGVLRRLEKLVA